MGFEYDKLKKKKAEENYWASYSDLYTMLSVVFLFLYVSVSLRQTTSDFSKVQELKRVTEQNQDLQQQLQVYNALRDNHLQQGATEREKEVYEKLMGKLDLLKEEARDEKDALRRQARENEEKEYALNEYQRMIRSILTTNLLAKSQIQRRDLLIDKKNENIRDQAMTIATQSTEIRQRESEIQEKMAQIAANRERVKRIQQDLQRKIAEVREAQQDREITQAAMNQKIAKLKEESQKRIQNLETQTQSTQRELSAAKSDLQAAQAQLVETRGQYEAQMAKLQGEREAFMKELSQAKGTAAEKAQRLAEFEASAKQKEQELQSQLGDLSKRVNEAQGEKERALASLEGVKKENAALAGDLKRAQELANARRALADRIRGELRKAGLKGDVNGETGDVTLAFGEEYFDTGSAQLKPTMTKILEKFMPGYSRSLFTDAKIASNIENVEIVGFASSTYKGRYVPPGSLRPEDQEAVRYNLKLSSDRAMSIFNHIFDRKKMSFQHQQELLPKIKVVGRGYLPDGKSSQDFPPGMKESDFCKRFNCRQSQKVIIKFNLKN